MPTKAQLESALVNADNSGDYEAAKALANALKAGQYDDAAPAQPEAQQPEQASTDQGMTLGQSWLINMLDNPVGEWLVRKAAPSEDEANKALEWINHESSQLRTGLVETAGTMASGMVAQPVSGLAGLVTAPFQGGEGATEVIKNVQQGMTYSPRTPEGQQRLQATGEVIEPVAEAFKAVEEGIGDAGDEAGGPLLGAMGQALPTAVLSILGLGMTRRALPSTKLKLRIAQDLKRASAQPELGRTIKAIAGDAKTGALPPKQLPMVIKGLEDEIVKKSGKNVFDTLSKLADDAKAGDVDAIRKLTQQADEIAQVSADSTLAKYISSGANKVKTDPFAKEAIKQGFDPGVITAAKGATQADRVKMLKMVETMEKGKKNALFSMKNRPSDIAGDSLLERVNHVKKVNKNAGAQLDTVAKSLKGKSIDFQEPIGNFIDNLDEMGIRIDKNLQPIFKGSDIEGLAGPQAAIRNIIKRLKSGVRGKTPDAYELHRMKKYIDENVTYGKGGEGLKGKTEATLKKLRRDLDSALDNQYPEYDRVNTEYADTIRALDALQDVAGKKVDLFGQNADKAVGTLLRRMMSNAQSRVSLVDAVDLMESTAKKYGATFNDDIATQMMFADELNSVFGPVAKTSLAGETAKGVKAAGRKAAEAASGQGGLFQTAVDVAGAGIEKMRGINEEGAFKAIKSVLERE